jgi:hypothetical protein
MHKAWKSKIGKNYVDRLPETVVQVGKDRFTRRDLVIKAGTANFFAAANLDRVLDVFKPKSVRELARRIDIHMLLKYEGIGDTAIMVWCSILDTKGVNVVAWLGQDFTERNKKKKKR